MNKDSKIGIFGAGIEGIALAEYLFENGFSHVVVYDENENVTIKLPEGVSFQTGKNVLTLMEDCEIVFRSPGIHTDRLNPLREKGVTVTSTVEYFLATRKGKVIGVTGTKGKGTTSTLIYEILKKAGEDVYLGGNIGESPINFIDKLKDKSWTVLELSSFQLQDLTVSPNISVVLMTTSEHLNYHSTVKEYRDAKKSIANFQTENDLLVLNVDYDYAADFIEVGKGKKMTVSTKKIVPNGTFLYEDEIVYAENGNIDKILNVKKVALPGPHNLENVIAAVTVAKHLQIPDRIIASVVSSFEGLPHRLEFVAEKEGVKYYNDSFSTTPETSVAASKAFDKPIILIAGGSEKQSDYSKWAMEMQKNPNLKMIVLMGVTADRMKESLDKAAQDLKNRGSENFFPVKIERVNNLEDAVLRARLNAKKGDYVIMSPAAASFDLFDNYKQRGEMFRKFVEL
jgi:UDP-N-acetylmuramoylalanine--D-glutamate ligase